MTYRIYVSNALCRLLMIYFIWKYIVNKEVKITKLSMSLKINFDFELSMNIQSKTSLKHKNTKRDNSKFQSSTRMNQMFFRILTWIASDSLFTIRMYPPWQLPPPRWCPEEMCRVHRENSAHKMSLRGFLQSKCTHNLQYRETNITKKIERKIFQNEAIKNLLKSNFWNFWSHIFWHFLAAWIKKERCYHSYKAKLKQS